MKSFYNAFRIEMVLYITSALCKISHWIQTKTVSETNEKHLQLKGYHLLPAGMSYYTPPYKADHVPLDYQIFPILWSNRKNLNSLEVYKNYLDEFITQKDVKLWKDGIMKLPQRWWKIVKWNDMFLNKSMYRYLNILFEVDLKMLQTFVLN